MPRHTDIKDKTGKADELRPMRVRKHFTHKNLVKYNRRAKHKGRIDY